MESNNPDNNNIIKKYNKIISIWDHWDKSFWSSFNIFILIMGLLFATFSQVYREWILAFTISFSAMFISIIWILILNRKHVHTIIAQNIGIDLETRIYQGLKYGGCFSEVEKFKKDPEEYILSNLPDWKDKWWKRRQIKATLLSSGLLSALIFPVFIFIIWFLLLICSILINC